MEDGSTQNEDAAEVTGTPAERGVYVDPEGRRIWPRHRRLAVRRARRLGHEPENSDEAMWILSDMGLDALADEDNLLELEASDALVVKRNEEDDDTDDDDDEAEQYSVPAKRRAQKNEVSNFTAFELTPEERDIEIAQIQRDLIKRRRRRLTFMIIRLMLFVFLPTAVFGYYYYTIASDMYETNSEFIIQTSDSPTSGGLGGLLSGTSFATVQDSIIVQDFLLSREAFLRLEAEHGFSEKMRSENIDILNRLPADATEDDAYSLFRKNVSIGYDPTEGVIRMKVIAPTPQLSQAYSESLVGYAEQRVDGLSQEARGDQVIDSELRYKEAEQDMLDAQNKVLALQQRRGILSVDAEVSSQMTIINRMESEIETKRLDLAEVRANERPNEIQERLLVSQIERLQSRVGELRNELTETTDTTLSLAKISAELSIAQTELATRQALLQQTLQQVETARIEANRQVRYLSVAIKPIAPVEATYPKKFEYTVLAFVIFLAIYIVLSLTVSILREQVSV